MTLMFNEDAARVRVQFYWHRTLPCDLVLCDVLTVSGVQDGRNRFVLAHVYMAVIVD